MQHLKAQAWVYCRHAFEDAATLHQMQTMRAQGATLSQIAEALTRAGVPAVRGGRWQAASVMGILRRHPLQPTKKVAYMTDNRSDVILDFHRERQGCTH